MGMPSTVTPQHIEEEALGTRILALDVLLFVVGHKRILLLLGPRASAHDRVVRNSLASLRLSNIPLIGWAIALAFWDRSLGLQVAALGFALLYVVVSRRIAHFRIPRKLVIRAGRARMLDADTASAKPR
jgi:hypothetical protein